jgi:hypothetical protein
MLSRSINKFISYLVLTLWSWALLGMPLDVRPLDLMNLMEPEGSTPNSQELSTCSNLETDQSSSTSPRSILILSTHLRLGLPSGSFPLASFMSFVRSLFLRWRVVSPTPKLEDRPLSFVRGSLFNIFAANFLNWRPFLHPQPKDAPCLVRACVLNFQHI